MGTIFILLLYGNNKLRKLTTIMDLLQKLIDKQSI